MASLQTVSRAKDKQFRAIGVTADYNFYFPLGHMITGLVVYNRTANAVTGGLDIGTTDSGEEVLSQLTVGANALLTVADTAILDRLFSLTASQRLYISAHTAWNSANLDIWFLAEKLRP